LGESAAGAGFTGTAGPGETVRIFTGAPLPAGTDRVVIGDMTITTDALRAVLDAVASFRR
jgi:molybdopterin molybdotransferase